MRGLLERGPSYLSLWHLAMSREQRVASKKEQPESHSHLWGGAGLLRRAGSSESCQGTLPFLSLTCQMKIEESHSPEDFREFLQRRNSQGSWPVVGVRERQTVVISSLSRQLSLSTA